MISREGREGMLIFPCKDITFIIYRCLTNNANIVFRFLCSAVASQAGRLRVLDDNEVVVVESLFKGRRTSLSRRFACFGELLSRVDLCGVACSLGLSWLLTERPIDSVLRMPPWIKHNDWTPRFFFT